MEDWEDAASGSCDVQPSPTLRGRYKNPPLMIRPDYSGDFLDKLRAPIQGKPIEGADENNLLDFSMPSEKIKHQEEPLPRIILDEYYSYNRPGQIVDQVLKDYHNRSWDNGDSPEISEDKLDRLGPPIAEPVGFNPFKSAQNVVASYLFNRFPISAHLIPRKDKTAKTLEFLQNSEITTKERGTRKVKEHLPGVTVRLFKAEPQLLKWTFNSSSGKELYTTIFQFIPKGSIQDLNRLDVRVNCTCPSFLYWGAQYNAEMEDFLYGKIRPKFAPPRVRDPLGKFLVCKHILACIPIVSKIIVEELPEKEHRKEIRHRKIEIEEKVPKEEIKIPEVLKNVENQPEIQNIIKKWDKMSPMSRRRFIMGLDSPETVEYMAHKFPDTAIKFVVEKLKLMERIKQKRFTPEKIRDIARKLRPYLTRSAQIL